MIQLGGILAPVVTPFDGAGGLDVSGFRRNLREHLAAGLGGIVVAGSTGEAALLDEGERLRLVEAARAEVPAGTPLVAGIGGESTRIVLERARAVASRGADAVLVVAPHYYADMMTPGALRAHYARIADESPLPVLLYTIPKYMHFSLPHELVAELALHDNVIGMKDSSGDSAMFARYLEARSDSFRVLTGSGSMFLDHLRLGADGAILAVSLFAPGLALHVLSSHRRGDDAAAGDAQHALGPLASRIVGSLGVPGVKRALDAVGLAGGEPRPPLLPLAEAESHEVEVMLAAARRPAAA